MTETTRATGTSGSRSEPPAAGAFTAEDIALMRSRIEEIDATIIRLWQERAGLSQQIGAVRMAAGGTRLALHREQEIMRRFRHGIGPDGTQLALLVLRAGRGPL
ncbi:chorismate mutase [Actinoplanes sp. NPDC049548]|uniref:chorismate mutase n=1 Tax=Actinoplanes sp. NPDC049548 TaxID=3155152 RepID=UPI00343EE727